MQLSVTPKSLIADRSNFHTPDLFYLVVVMVCRRFVHRTQELGASTNELSVSTLLDIWIESKPPPPQLVQRPFLPFLGIPLHWLRARCRLSTSAPFPISRSSPWSSLFLCSCLSPSHSNAWSLKEFRQVCQRMTAEVKQPLDLGSPQDLLVAHINAFRAAANF